MSDEVKKAIEILENQLSVMKQALKEYSEMPLDTKELLEYEKKNEKMFQLNKLILKLKKL